MGNSKSGNHFSELWAELQRRRVIRVVVLYIIGGWLVIEAAELLLPNLNLPEWTVTLVIALVILGLPIVVILAWVFDIGPAAVVRTEQPDAEAASDIAEATPQKGLEKPAVESAKDGRRSIAVLPFVNMSGELENEYFSDGISEEILNLLAKLPKLRVASRTSSFALKGKDMDIPAVAAKLGVQTVLEGSVRRAGGRVRITAQLIETDTDSHLWSETYDREFEDVFSIQDDIAAAIVNALEVTLTPKERRSIQFVATSDPKAYDFYLRGRNYMYTMARRDYEHAISMFEQAIDLDPNYALAYAGLADAYSHLYRYSEATPENLNLALENSEKAVDLDSDSAEAHASRGLALFINGRNREAAEQLDESRRLNPGLFEAYYYDGLSSSAIGDFERAVSMYKKAMQINPQDYAAPTFLAQAYGSLGRRHDEMKARVEALDTFHSHLEMNPHDTRALYMGATNLSCVGEFEKGKEWAERALGQDENEPVVLYNVACFYATKGETEHAIDLLEKAVERGWGDRAWLETDSDLDSLQNEPRFIRLLEQIS